MTTERDPATRIVLSWLREEAHENAERVLLRALDEVETTPQRRSWRPARRFASLNTYSKLGLGAAAVVAVLILSYNYLPALNRNGGAATPSPAPSPIPMPSGPLPAGTYLFPKDGEIVPTAFTITLPSGWRNESWAITKGPGAILIVSPWAVQYTYGDPCHWQSTVVDPGPTVEGLAQALSRQAGRHGTTPVPATLGGYSGLRLELDVDSFVLADCDSGEYREWVAPGPGVTGSEVDEPGRGGIPVGLHSEVWILDVDGTRLLIEASYQSTATTRDRAELDSVVRSIVINP